MDNINRLANMNKLVVAGPMEKNDHNYRGIFILNVKTTEEAKELLDTDPTIKNHIFEVELYEWYGSAALPMYIERLMTELPKRIFKIQIPAISC